MKKEWGHITKLTGDRPLVIERVSLEGEEIALEGRFELPPLARPQATNTELLVKTSDISHVKYIDLCARCHSSMPPL